jgi:hypothetical protein
VIFFLGIDSKIYKENKHWHIGYYKQNLSIECIAFQKKDDNSWDVFFNDFLDDREFEALFPNKATERDPYFGIFIFNSIESEVSLKFENWLETILLSYRGKN